MLLSGANDSSLFVPSQGDPGSHIWPNLSIFKEKHFDTQSRSPSFSPYKNPGAVH